MHGPNSPETNSRPMCTQPRTITYRFIILMSNSLCVLIIWINNFAPYIFEVTDRPWSGADPSRIRSTMVWRGSPPTTDTRPHSLARRVSITEPPLPAAPRPRRQGHPATWPRPSSLGSRAHISGARPRTADHAHSHWASITEPPTSGTTITVTRIRSPDRRNGFLKLLRNSIQSKFSISAFTVNYIFQKWNIIFFDKI